MTLEQPKAAILQAALAPLDEALDEALPLLARSVASVIHVLAFLAPWLVLGAILFGAVRVLRFGFARRP